MRRSTITSPSPSPRTTSGVTQSEDADHNQRAGQRVSATSIRPRSKWRDTAGTWHGEREPESPAGPPIRRRPGFTGQDTLRLHRAAIIDGQSDQRDGDDRCLRAAEPASDGTADKVVGTDASTGKASILSLRPSQGMLHRRAVARMLLRRHRRPAPRSPSIARVRVLKPGKLTDTAAVTADGPDPDPSTDHAQAVVHILAAAARRSRSGQARPT